MKIVIEKLPSTVIVNWKAYDPKEHAFRAGTIQFSDTTGNVVGLSTGLDHIIVLERSLTAEVDTDEIRVPRKAVNLTHFGPVAVDSHYKDAFSLDGGKTWLSLNDAQRLRDELTRAIQAERQRENAG